MATGYPIPITPAPLISAHAIEIDRAKAAEDTACQSSAVTSQAILYEDDWIVAVNKPAGRYCEDVLAGVTKLLGNPRHREGSHDEISAGACSYLINGRAKQADENQRIRIEKRSSDSLAKEMGAFGLGRCNEALEDDGVKEVCTPPPESALTLPREKVHRRPSEARLAKQHKQKSIAAGDQEIQAEPVLAYMVHRLDRDTSGVQIVAKSKQAAAAFMKLFADRHVSKTYLALGHGTCPNWRQTTLRTGHGRSRHGMFRVYAEADVGRILPGGKAARVQSMETRFEVLGTFVPGEGRGDGKSGKRNEGADDEPGESVTPVREWQLDGSPMRNGRVKIGGGCSRNESQPPTEKERETEPERKTKMEMETDTETEAATVTETEAGTATKAETGTGPRRETEQETSTERRPRSKTARETDTETVTEPEPELGSGPGKSAPGRRKAIIGVHETCAECGTSSGPSPDYTCHHGVLIEQGSYSGSHVADSGLEETVEMADWLVQSAQWPEANASEAGARASSVSASFLAESVQSGLSSDGVSTSSDPNSRHSSCGNQPEMASIDTGRSDLAEVERFVLLRCYPLTGRTHQIRLHCLYLGMPLVGDARYGGLLEAAGKEQTAHCLHAESLSLRHPFLETELHLQAPSPPWVIVSKLWESSR